MLNLYNLELDKARNVRLCREKGIDYNTENINTPKAVVRMLEDCFHLSSKAEEYVYVICTRACGTVMGIFELSHGSFDASYVGARELFTKVLLLGSHSFIVAHNHPGGSIIPSCSDINVCRKIWQGAKLLDIEMNDFLIIGNGYTSFKERGLLEGGA